MDLTDSRNQFRFVFEDVYNGSALEGVPWFGVLGDRDYGHSSYTGAWDQTIHYTWGRGGRWVTPAQYWRRRVQLREFAADFFFLDTNSYSLTQEDNVCARAWNVSRPHCPVTGPQSPEDC